jgi:hypothetical protein
MEYIMEYCNHQEVILKDEKSYTYVRCKKCNGIVTVFPNLTIIVQKLNAVENAINKLKPLPFPQG